MNIFISVLFPYPFKTYNEVRKNIFVGFRVRIGPYLSYSSIKHNATWRSFVFYGQVENSCTHIGTSPSVRELPNLLRMVVKDVRSLILCQHLLLRSNQNGRLFSLSMLSTSNHLQFVVPARIQISCKPGPFFCFTIFQEFFYSYWGITICRWSSTNLDICLTFRTVTVRVL